MERRLVSIVVPVYYNSDTLRDLYARFLELEEAAPGYDWEYVFVDDGSGDDSFGVLCNIQEKDGRVGILKLARNFGSHAAILAGLAVAKGDAVAFISADLQDDPILLKAMLADWLNGVPVVLAVREGREDSPADRFFAWLYYALVRRMSIGSMPKGGFDFALLDRQVVDELTRMQEKNTTITGLIMWLGFKHTEHGYRRRAREKGKSRWTLRRKFKMFIDSVVPFSYLPIRLMSTTGILLSMAAFTYAGFIIINKIVSGFPVQGWSSLMVAILILSGVQMLSIGILGEYIWRVLDSNRNRPPFVVQRNISSCYGNQPK